MATILEKDLSSVKDFYYKKFYSAREISEKFNVSIDAVYYFMRRYKLKRRNFSEENKSRFSRKKPSFILKKKLSNREKELKIVGSILYWGEGYKTEKSCTVDFANCDPAMITIFLNFLRNICGIQESKLRVLLYCYSNQNIDQLLKFWSKKTSIPIEQFSKPYVKQIFEKPQENKMPYGLIHIRYHDKKLLLLIKKWIEEYKIIFG